MKTPVPKCLELATYSIRIFGEFPTNVVLVALGAEMTGAKTNFASAQQQYEEAVQEILEWEAFGGNVCRAAEL